MKKSTIKLVAGAIFQFQAGAEVETITTADGVFYKVADSDGAEVVTEEQPTNKKSEPKAEAKEEEVEVVKETAKKSDNYTKDELFNMEVKELKNILKDLGVNPDDFDGKNTNKKLRDLILDAQAGKLEPTKEDDSDVVDDTEEEVETAKPSRRRGAKAEKVEEEEEELTEIEEEEWEDLKEGSTAYARLVEDDELQEKLWEVEIVGWAKPKGSKNEEFFVKFLEDDTEDFLREGDKLYQYSVSL